MIWCDTYPPANIPKEGRWPWENVLHVFSSVRDTGAWVHNCKIERKLGLSYLCFFLHVLSPSLPLSSPSVHINSNLVWNLNCFRSHSPLMELRISSIARLAGPWCSRVCMHNEKSYSEISQGKHLSLLTHSPDPDFSFSSWGFMFWVSINQTMTGNLMILHIPRKNNKIRML